MRKVTIEKTYLTFDELDEKKRAKVIDNNRDINVYHDWYWFIYEDFKKKLERLGFYQIKFYWTGFYSQGDGASFEAKHKRGTIYRVGHYYHEFTMRCDESDALLLVAQRYAQDLYCNLREEYEYLTSDDAIKETIKCNDYEFDKDTLEIV